MAGYNYDELDLTPEERELLKRAESEAGFGTQIGSLVGSGVGLAGSGALAAGTGGATAPLIPLITGLGGSAGGAIGQIIGSATAAEAEEKLQKKLSERQKRDRDALARMQALDELGGEWIPRVKGL